MMSDTVQRGSVGLLLGSVLVLFLLPAFHLEPTAMRAQRAAINLFLTVSSSILLSTAVVRPTSYSSFDGYLHAPDDPTTDLLDLICARLC